jgi:enoyl-CoA hydratase/carnithine racemase
VRAVVLTGSGKNFSYGLDMPAMGGSLSEVIVGGGVDLISAVDIRYASAHAKFSVREVKLALTVNGIKDVLDQQRIARVSESLRYVAVWNTAMLPSKDLTEGITATFAKRAPNFTGE